MLVLFFNFWCPATKFSILLVLMCHTVCNFHCLRSDFYFALDFINNAIQNRFEQTVCQTYIALKTCQ